MKKIAIIIALLISSVCIANAADSPRPHQVRTITVKGTGRASATPDRTVINFTVSSLNKNYEKAIKENTDKINRLEKAIVACGLNKEALTTSNFNVYAQNERKNIDNVWTDVFVGYNCSQYLSIEFELDQKLIGKVLGAIVSCDASPSFSISFKIKDTEPIKEAVLKDAVGNARKKAEAICEQVGCHLGAVQKIEYNVPRNDYVSRSTYSMSLKAMAYANDSIEAAINPEDINVTDEVTVIWQIL
ncbi:MAG: SIMPL domain-containing protein [Bacteroidales bacterium]|nr:SIMPL domain-containing protein [Bacteroidales bacterium]